MRAGAGGCLVRERKASENGKLKGLEPIELSISRPRLDERNLARNEFLFCAWVPIPVPERMYRSRVSCPFRLFGPVAESWAAGTQSTGA